MDENRIRQLERQLVDYQNASQAVDIHHKIDILNELAWMLSDTDMKRAYALSETAYDLANSFDADRSPYQAGIAYSLRTQGYLNMRFGNYPLGLTQLLKARDLIETLQLDEGLPDVLDGIAGIYYQIGDYPEALNYAYKQLEAAQRIGNNRQIANANNNLVAVYSDTGQYDRAIDTLEKNLRIAIEIGYKRIECLSYLNLSGTYLAAGNYAKALQFALVGLPVSQEAGYELFEVYALGSIGEAYSKLGDTQQAIDYFERALALSIKLESKVTESLILLDLGRAYYDLYQLDQAVDYLQQGITTAGSIDARSELFKTHLLLSEIYEKQADFAQALNHFKQYQYFKELVFGEKADQRLKVLQVAHDTESARKEAEILQLKTQQLEQEITEQKQVEQILQEAHDKLEGQVKIRTAELNSTIAQLKIEIGERERAEAEIQQLVETLEQRVAARTEELVTFFDLILLAAEAGQLADVFDQALPRILDVSRNQAICIHLLEADQNTLRLAAQQNLHDETRTGLQIVELQPDFKRWLEQPNEPLITTDLHQMTILPPVFRLPEFQTYLGVQIRTGNRIEGLLSCYRSSNLGYGLDDIALIIALAEQIGMMLENHRLRQNAEEVAVLEERQRLARDLHDSVTQYLYSLSLFTRAGREAAEDGDTDRLKHSLNELERNTLFALREMRLLLYELRPADLEEGGLIPAIEMRLNSVERRAGLQLDIRLDECSGLSPGMEVEIYHIIVEALNNVVKHAAATRLTLHLTQADGYLDLQIADDGQGFDPTQAAGGMGLINIRERVARLSGQLSITREPGNGMRLEARIPCHVEDEI